MSTTRIMKASTLPPMKPAVAPQTMPRVTEDRVARKPTMRETRPPTRLRTSKSRPDSSVPKKCQFLSMGGMLMASQSAASKACGSSQGPTMQVSVMRSSRHRLSTAALLRKKRARASAQGLRPEMSAASSVLPRAATSASGLFLNSM